MLGSCDYKKGSHDNHKRGCCDQNQRSCLVRVLCVIDAGKEHGKLCEFYLVVLLCELGGSGWGGMEHVGGKEAEKLACRLIRKEVKGKMIH